MPNRHALAPAARAVAGLLLAGFAGPLPAAAGDAEFFDHSIRPLLKEYCLKCHSTEEQKGDLDLEVFTSLPAVQRQPKVWLSVVEQLANSEMRAQTMPEAVWTARLPRAAGRQADGFGTDPEAVTMPPSSRFGEPRWPSAP